MLFSNRHNIVPSKFVSAIAMCVGIAFAAAGIFMLIMLMPEEIALDFSLLPVIFLGIWTLAAIGIALYHGLNVFRKNGLAVLSVQSTPSKFDRLSELKKLFDAGLISQAEFDNKKSKILDRI